MTQAEEPRVSEMPRLWRAVSGRRYLATVVVFYGVVSPQTGEAIELFIRRGDAERFVKEVRDDDPELAELLSVEQVELTESSAVSPPN